MGEKCEIILAEKWSTNTACSAPVNSGIDFGIAVLVRLVAFFLPSAPE
jgi:hypothetical protein